MNKIEKRYHVNLAKKIKDFIHEYRPQMDYFEQTFKIYYIKKYEGKTKAIYHNILGADVKYISFKERYMSQREKALYNQIAFINWFFIYMVAVIVIGLLNPVIGFDWKWVELLSYIGNLGGVVCAYFIFKGAFYTKKFSFIILGLIVLFANGFLAYEFLTKFVF